MGIIWFLIVVTQYCLTFRPFHWIIEYWLICCVFFVLDIEHYTFLFIFTVNVNAADLMEYYNSDTHLIFRTCYVRVPLFRFWIKSEENEIPFQCEKFVVFKLNVRNPQLILGLKFPKLSKL